MSFHRSPRSPHIRTYTSTHFAFHNLSVSQRFFNVPIDRSDESNSTRSIRAPAMINRSGCGLGSRVCSPPCLAADSTRVGAYFDTVSDASDCHCPHSKCGRYLLIKTVAPTSGRSRGGLFVVAVPSVQLRIGSDRRKQAIGPALR